MNILHIPILSLKHSQETLSRSQIVGTENGNGSDFQATWNEANNFELHSSEAPIAMHIKTEDDI